MQNQNWTASRDGIVSVSIVVVIVWFELKPNWNIHLNAKELVHQKWTQAGVSFKIV